MEKKNIDHIKCILFYIIFSLIETLYGDIFTVNSENEACSLLDNIIDKMETWNNQNKIPMVFVDIDGTIIENCSDYHSYRYHSNFSDIRPINLKLIKKLWEFRMQFPSVKIVGFTSGKCCVLVQRENNIIFLPILLQHGTCLSHEEYSNTLKILGKKSSFEIRSEAMKYLNLPFDFGTDIKKLPFILSSPIDSPLEFSHRLRSPDFFEIEIFSYKNYECKQNITQQCEFYIKAADKYHIIQAHPIYGNGIIFMNSVNPQDAWRKGPVLKSFLFSMFKGKEMHSLIIVVIDDNLKMLKSIQKQCDDLELLFFGIHLDYATKKR